MKRIVLLAAFLLAAIPSFATLKVGVNCDSFGSGDQICSATQASPWNFAFVNAFGMYRVESSIACASVTDGRATLHVVYTDDAGNRQDYVAAFIACDASLPPINTTSMLRLTVINSFVSAYIVTSGTSAPLRTNIQTTFLYSI